MTNRFWRFSWLSLRSGDRRRKTLAFIVVLALGFGVGALATMQFVKSPAESAAEAGPPLTGPVTVPVERRVLRSTLVMRGDVVAATSTAIRPPAATSGGTLLISGLPRKVGDTVTAGQVVAEVSGRPVLVLPGNVPAYRNLVPGAEGPDVIQLQVALAKIGKSAVTQEKGVYGPATKAAVAALFKAAGYQAQPTNPGDDQQLLSAQRRVRDAEQSGGQMLLDAKEDLAILAKTTGPTVPLGEIAFVASLPAKVASSTATIGAPAGESLLTLAGDELLVRGRLSPQNASLARPGQPVQLTSEQLNMTADGVVHSVGEPAARPAATGSTEGPNKAPTPPQAGGSEIVVHGNASLDQRLSGQNVRLTIEQASTSGEVLVVPLAAVSVRADAQSQLVRVNSGNQEERLPIIAGVSGGGYVEVKPISGKLEPGDRVVVGR